MNELRRDYVKNKWVSIASSLGWKPKDFPIMKVNTTVAPGAFCPFCEGNEAITPPEIAAYRIEGSEPNGTGWIVRAIPNKFTAFDMDGELNQQEDGVLMSCYGLGKHEVILETPRHDVDFHQLPLENMALTIAMLRERYNDLTQDQRLKYIQIYKNRGMFGGASLGHSHTQLIGLPFVPSENEGLPLFYKMNGKCFVCAYVEKELEMRERVIDENEHFVVLCPYASRFAYETWIVPKRHTKHFGQLNEAEEKTLAQLCKKVSQALVTSTENASYNFMINSAPINSPYVPGYHWYMEFTPRLLVSHGFEISSGVYMNPTAPETAAEALREVYQSIG